MSAGREVGCQPVRQVIECAMHQSDVSSNWGLPTVWGWAVCHGLCRLKLVTGFVTSRPY